MNIFHGAMLEFVGTKAINAGQLPNASRASAWRTSSPCTRGGRHHLRAVGVLPRPRGRDPGHLGDPALHRPGPGHLRHGRQHGGGEAVAGSTSAARSSSSTATSGLLASIMGIIHVSLIRYSNATYIIDSELLHVIAAVILGGASILGGSGTLTGTLLGVVMISILEKNLVLLGLSSYWQQFFVGPDHRPGREHHPHPEADPEPPLPGAGTRVRDGGGAREHQAVEQPDPLLHLHRRDGDHVRRSSPSQFMTLRNFTSMGLQFPEYGLLALANMLAMITGGIDLSVVSIASLSGVDLRLPSLPVRHPRHARWGP